MTDYLSKHPRQFSFSTKDNKQTPPDCPMENPPWSCRACDYSGDYSYSGDSATVQCKYTEDKKPLPSWLKSHQLNQSQDDFGKELLDKLIALAKQNNQPDTDQGEDSVELVEKDIIAERKAQYGNNFPMIAELWNNYLSREFDNPPIIKPQDVALMLGLMKISRLANSPNHEDSLTDLINYFFIALNYDEYLGFDGSKDS